MISSQSVSQSVSQSWKKKARPDERFLRSSAVQLSAEMTAMVDNEGEMQSKL